jgi:hypothetical protein
MMIHYVWIGGDIPVKYLPNIKICSQLNPGYQIIYWKDNDVNNIISEFGLIDLFNSLSFMGKCNLAKYTILAKYGGIITDLDIKWKKSFYQIQIDNNFPQVDLILTYPFIKELFDEAFIIAKPGLFKDCIEYSKQRINLKIDISTGKQHKLEPIGPFLLTEWVNNKNINFTYFSQALYLDGNGHYGNHEQLGLWS